MTVQLAELNCRPGHGGRSFASRLPYLIRWLGDEGFDRAEGTGKELHVIVCLQGFEHDPVDDFFYSEIPPEVWHYTSMKGLNGILSSGSMWATNVRFTNDSTEFIHGRDLAIADLKSLKTKTPSQAFAKNAAIEIIQSSFREGAISPEETEVYLVSFSALADRKSQWSDYGDQHRGVSIAFDFSRIRPPRGMQSGVTFAQCLYDDLESEKLLRAAVVRLINVAHQMHEETGSPGWVAERAREWAVIQRIFNLPNNRREFESNLNGQFEDRLHSAATHAAFDLLRLASHSKNPAFQEEGEWRLALPRSRSKPHLQNPVRFRGADGKVPYILADLRTKDGQMPITRVMLGPLCQAEREVRDLLTRYGYRVPVERSSIPLRVPTEPAGMVEA